MASRVVLLAGTNAICSYLKLLELLMHVGPPGKKSEKEAMYSPARVAHVRRRRHLGPGAELRRTVSFT